MDAGDIRASYSSSYKRPDFLIEAKDKSWRSLYEKPRPPALYPFKSKESVPKGDPGDIIEVHDTLLVRNREFFASEFSLDK